MSELASGLRRERGRLPDSRPASPRHCPIQAPREVLPGHHVPGCLGIGPMEGERLDGTSDLVDGHRCRHMPDDPSSQRSVPPTTDTRATNKSVRTPLIYRIQDFSTARNSPYSHSKAVDFVVYDAAGEDIENKRNMERWGRYITESSAILFLIDPSRFAHVRNSLADVDTGTSRTGRSSAVLDYIVDRFERQQLLSPTDPIPVPIVFSIMKSDLLKTILPQSSRIPLDSYHRGGVDLEDIQLVSQEIESLLHGWGEGNFRAKCRRFSNSCFCAVSAVGEQPGPDNTFSDLRPIRVLDPLFWILHKLGYARAIS